MIIKINGQELAEVSTPPLTSVMSAPANIPWWDLSGQMDLAMESFKEGAQEFFTDVIAEFLKALATVIVDLSYSAALLGGGILIIVKVVTGFKKAGQWLSLLLLVHFLIQFILG